MCMHIHTCLHSSKAIRNGGGALSHADLCISVFSQKSIRQLLEHHVGDVISLGGKKVWREMVTVDLTSDPNEKATTEVKVSLRSK